jgi:hypothetical protein
MLPDVVFAREEADQEDAADEAADVRPERDAAALLPLCAERNDAAQTWMSAQWPIIVTPASRPR